jgi:hypothetical protein
MAVERYTSRMQLSIWRRVPFLVTVVCGVGVAQITGTVTSLETGRPIAGALVMGEGLNWARSDSNGQYTLPPARFRGLNAPPEVPVSFRSEGYRPATRIAAMQDSVVNVALEDGKASAWTVPLCKETLKMVSPCGVGPGAKPHAAIGNEMVLRLPCDAAAPIGNGDVDYSSQFVSYTHGDKTYYLRTMSGPICCSGHPLAAQYLSAQWVSERAWLIRLNSRRGDGLDARGISFDGTRWRWVGPLVGEFAEYVGADSDAAKYFDAILDGVCFQPKF